jgi:radical SAM/Cys-rich protein
VSIEKTVSLKKRNHSLSAAEKQVLQLENGLSKIPGFEQKLLESGFIGLSTSQLEILQINVGKMCNQTCKHCHVDAGPDRKEIMSRETMEDCLRALGESKNLTIDLTGGAPEMNPNFKWFVRELRARKQKVLVRCNLTIINSNPKYHDLPEFYSENEVELISSLPHFSKIRTDAQRGDGVFERSLDALQKLNKIGYGMVGSGLILNLVYNPTGAFLPSGQESLESEFKEKLKSKHGVHFNQLFAITNMPISRFLDFLISTGNYESYMENLINAFNPGTLEGLMCRNTLSVGWDGFLYDCDFNQMLELGIENGGRLHIRDFEEESYPGRSIRVGRHCFGCTAGAGSSCGGEIT